MKIKITGEFIKIGQLLKKIGVTDTGGTAKWFLENNEVKINGVITTQRGKKVKPKDVIWINDDLYQVTK